jgi:hypothetical protein
VGNRMDLPKGRSLDLLRSIKPEDVAFHAARWTSGQGFQILIERAHTEHLDAVTIGTIVREICLAGRLADGVDYGSIPCLGGEPLRVWTALRLRYGLKTS